jgi:hypothetical protein
MLVYMLHVRPVTPFFFFLVCMLVMSRYIIQVSIVWAVPSCKTPGASPGGSIPMEASRLASSKNAQGPTNVYLWDKDTVDLIPQGIEGATVVYDGVTITKPSEGVAVPTIPVSGSSQGSTAGPTQTTPAQSQGQGSKVQEEKALAEKPAVQQAAAKEAVAQQTGGAGKAGCVGGRAVDNCDTGVVLAAVKN